MPHKATISKNGYVFTIEGGYTSFEIFQNDVQPKKCKYPGITQSLYVNFNSIQKIVEVFTNGGISEQSDKLLISVNLNDICKTYRNFCNQELKSDSLLKLKDVLRICNFIEHHFYMKFSVTRDVADVGFVPDMMLYSFISGYMRNIFADEISEQIINSVELWFLTESFDNSGDDQIIWYFIRNILK